MSPATRQLLIAIAPAALIRVFSPGADAAAWLTLFVTVAVTSYLWAMVFSRLRMRQLDAGWLPHALIFSLMIPATLPLGFAALALSFGLVFGCHVFGGSRSYLVHPALLGAVFIAFSYPAMVDNAAWQTADQNAAAWFAAACLLGALWLIAVGRASALLVAGGVIGATVAGLLLGELSPMAHLVLGHFAFALAFVATDDATQPETPAGCMIFGLLFGALTIVLRTADPNHPEGTWAALLLASLAVPLIDHLTTPARRAGGSDAADTKGAAQ